LRLILTECGDRCCISTDLDFKRIKTRYEHEGFAFLGITLANYGKDFQKSLDQGFVSPDLFLAFEKRAGLPELFRGFLENVFEPLSGRLLSSPCVDCIHSLRQLSLMWAKVNAPTTPVREKKAFDSFMVREQHVYDSSDKIARSSLYSGSSSPASVGFDLQGLQERIPSSRIIEDSDLFRYHQMSRRLFGPIFNAIDRKINREEIVPRHGPGATADRHLGNSKWSSEVAWPVRLECSFPSGKFFYTSFSSYLASGASYMDPGPEIPVRVISVPKTLDKPRIIAIEPTAMQYMQQALKREFEIQFKEPFLKYGKRKKVNFSHHFVDYSSQIPNQVMARIGSRLGTNATLDLSDASDSVSNLLVNILFTDHPNLWNGVQDTRSYLADVQGHGITPLTKFASMGSALCFPIEALVFTTIVFLGIQKSMRRPLSRKLLESFIGHVRVYGDDIIVPVEFATSVVSELENFGFTVSKHKSFWNGKFRESCGKDYYDDEDISIVRLRREIPTHRKQTEPLIGFVEFRNLLYKSGFWSTVKSIDQWIEEIIPFPAMTEGAPGLGKVSFLGYEVHKMDRQLQRPLVRAAVPIYVKRSSPLDGDRALMKWFMTKLIGVSDPLSHDHLQFAGRPVSVNIMTRYVHPDYGVDWHKPKWFVDTSES
jgi:hypothetical protein